MKLIGSFKKVLPDYHIFCGDSLEILKQMPDETFQCVITSPPYWGLRDYGVEGQLGIEKTFAEYLEKLVVIFHEVKRVLRKDGACWVNMGDNYTDKQLIGQPWRLAFGLQENGWYLRSDVIWEKPNVMPESVKDRPSRSHEYLFMLTKSPKYYYDAGAIKVPISPKTLTVSTSPRKGKGNESAGEKINKWTEENGGRYYPEKRNIRTVWRIATIPYKEAHFATFPKKLIEPCILASSRIEDIVLDPFSGAGTTGVVALQHGRRFVGIELNPEYIEMSERRIGEDYANNTNKRSLGPQT